jgi:hypothetical protein
MDSFDRNWRGLQLETLVDLSLTIGGVLSEEELVEELLQRAVGTLDAGSGFVSTLHPGGHEAIVRSIGLPQSVEVVRSFPSAGGAGRGPGGPRAAGERPAPL